VARNLNVIDATCPLVTKVHLEAVKFARKGYSIVLIGHENHDEVVGTLGEAPEAMKLVSTVEDVGRARGGGSHQDGLSDADDVESGRDEPHCETAGGALPADPGTAFAGHLLCDREAGRWR
jgi:hypothetical protein